MAEDKKPKIDLKARLGKGAQTPPPAAVAPPPASGPASSPRGAVDAPVAAPPRANPVPTPMQPMAPGVPVGPPPGFGSGSQPPRVDPNNPLAAMASPYRPQVAPAPPPQPQRIEVDEMAVQSAARSARKQGVVIGSIFALVLGGIGYVIGGAHQQGEDRSHSHSDAVELKADVGKARDALKTIADKVEAGTNTISKDHKFPETLAQELAGIVVDFDGTKLAGRRFSGFPAATAQDLVAFITAVQAANDRKELIEGLLTQLKKPIMEQLASAGQINVSYVVAVSKDPAGNFAGFLSSLQKPIQVTKDNLNLPPKLTFTDPGGGNAEAPRYPGGDISTTHSVLYVVPKSFDTACPSAKSGQITQLGAQMGNYVHEIRGDKAADTADVVQDSKPGLIERAEKLMGELDKVAN